MKTRLLAILFALMGTGRFAPAGEPASAVSSAVPRVSAAQQAPSSEAASLAQYENALDLFKNLNDEESLKKGYDLLGRAAAAGQADAQNALGLCKIFGFGTGMDPSAGLDLVRKAAEAGSPKALFNMSSLTALHIGFKGDSSNVLSYLERAALKGDAESQFQLGLDLLDPHILYSPDLAILWFKKAADNGNQTAAAFAAGLNATRAIKNANEESGLAQLKKLSDARIAAAKFWLGRYRMEDHYPSSSGNRPDPVSALDYFIQADELGLRPEACEQARKLINKIAHEGSPEQVNKVISFLETKQTNNCLANALLGGIYVVSGSKYQDYAKGKAVLEIGAKAGCELAIVNLGDMCRLGLGDQRDPAKAIDYYTLAPKKSGEALYKLAGMAFDLTTPGMLSQRQNAYHAALEAAKMGVPEAYELLAKMLAQGGVGESDERVKSYAWAMVAANEDPEAEKVLLSRFGDKLSLEQRAEGAKIAQFFRILVQRRPLQEGGKLFRF